MKAEEFLTQKSEINTSDYEKCIKNKKDTSIVKKRKHCEVNDSTDESDDDNESVELPAAPIKRFISCHNAAQMENAFNVMSTPHSRQQTESNALVST